MTNNSTYEFQPDYERVTLIGLPGTESSGRSDGIELWSSFEASALRGLKYIRERWPKKYKSGLHIYIGEHNDHLWLGFNNAGDFLINIFMDQLKKNLPKEDLTIEETGAPPIPMIYSYYPDRILVFGKDAKVGESYKDEEYGTLLNIIPGEMFPEDMKALL